jgi:hypothetical protein
MLRIKFLLALAVFCLTSTLSFSQDGFVSNWLQTVDKAKEEQPHWITPVATTTPRLEQEYRYDQFWQTNSKHVTTDNYDGGKGVELIPTEKTEIIFNLPAYIDHNNSKVKNGFGDEAFLLKYRFLSANEKKGNYILTGFLGATIPTGSHTNGAKDATITPTIAYGKGFGNFDGQGTFGITWPTGDTKLIGRTYSWNNTLQYRLLKKIWPEVEFNTTRYQSGPNDGKTQNFITPGIIFGRMNLVGRVGLSVGGGFQIATSQFHTTNHNGILTVRFPF